MAKKNSEQIPVEDALQKVLDDPNAPQMDENEFERHLIALSQQSTFFAYISSCVTKVKTLTLPTAAVSYNPATDQLQLLWNPKFFAMLSDWEVQGVLTHEFYHVVFGHITSRIRTPPQLWNIATDFAINAIIIATAVKRPNMTGERPLPEFCLVPGRPVAGMDPNMAAKVKGWPDPVNDKTNCLQHPSEWYFNELIEFAPQCDCGEGGEGDGEGNEGKPGDKNGVGGAKTLDDHGEWSKNSGGKGKNGELTEEQREYAEGKVKAIVEKAANAANQSSTGWGNVPADVRAAIDAYLKGNVDWRKVLRQFIGNLIRGNRTNTIKRINKRYPYVHPGTKKGYSAKLLIAMDQSGSVGNEMLAEFFAELGLLTKRVGVELIPFDCDINIRDLKVWKKGQKIEAVRERMGGTDFNAPTNLFNDPKNRGRWDGLLIMTDGEAPAPGGCRGKRGWVLGKGCNTHFETSELKIFVEPGRGIESGGVAW